MKYLPILSLLILLTACRDRRENLEPASDNHIRFTDMQVGQTSRYLRFDGESYFDPQNFNFSYVSDTLQLKIIGVDANGYLIEDRLTPGSISVLNNEPNANEVYQFYWKIEQDTLFMNSTDGNPWFTTRLGYSGFALPLTQITAPEVDIKGWKTDHGYTESYWTATDPVYSLFGTFYADLNVVTDNRSMQVDGPGFWYAYRPENGIVKMAVYSWWTSTGSGWDLLPDGF